MSKGGRITLIVGGILLVLLAIAVAVWGLSARWGGGYWGRMGPGMMGGFGGAGFMALAMLVFWGFVVWVIIAMVRSSRYHHHVETAHGGDSSLEILKRRYASGEINKDEYEQKKKDLLS